MAVFRNDLFCEVSSLAYDFDKRAGRLVMAEDQSTDMTGCIAIFSAIDPEVRTIETFAGAKSDTVYKRDAEGEWGAALTR